MTVILIITSNLVATLIVAVSVFMTNLFLLGLIYYWGLTLNPVVMLNMTLSIGTSVDFSAHIAYAYLTEAIPEKKKHLYDTPAKIRNYKARQALSKMGSSVFHGGFSTFIALSVLSTSKTYIFVAFYKLWFGIIVFGMANGFFLVPVILSFFGPTLTVLDPVLL